jgi:hypothetical protein
VSEGGAQHPSSLALDRHALGVATPEVAAHVASCEACRARLAAPADTVPAWARQLPPRHRGWLAWAGRVLAPVGPRRGAFGLAAALACVALVWAAGRHGTTPAGPGDYVGTKGGGPELWLYVKRGDGVALWNGSDAVAPGDQLRLKIQPGRFKHVTIFGATGAAGAYNRLYDGAIAPGEPTALPFSLRVDAQPGDESLLIVLAAAPAPPDQVEKLLAGDADRDGSRWSRRLVLAKTVNQRDGSRP